MTPHVDQIVWDDELERLALTVSDLFGDAVLFGAMRRALHAASARREADPAGADASAGRLLESCLRDELHRLLRPH